jgi:hypothetical protein
MSKTYTPNLLRKPGSLDDDAMTLSDCAERYLTNLWDDMGLAKAGYDPARDALGSDPHYRAKIAEHAVLGYPSRDDFEAQLRRDFQLNEQAIGNVDAELLALVPDRVMFLADTRLPFDNPELLKLTVENFQKLGWTEPTTKDAEVPAAKEPRLNPPRPVLTGVTWSPVAYRSGALFRGYHHALVIRGQNFTTGLQYAHRREGEGFPAGDTDYFWRAPNLLVPNQAEISVSGDDLEGPLSWRGDEFCVRNSPEEMSDWIKFEYPFDDQQLAEELQKCEESGAALHRSGDFEAAEKFLRRGWVFSDRMYGAAAARTKQLWTLREANLDDLVRSKLRFAVGDRIIVCAGEHQGATGTVRSVLLRVARAYEIATDAGETIYAADKEVQCAVRE